jgi:ParB family chromosome partitioning protein
VKQVSNQQALEMTIVENLQREDLNPMEHARAFERLGREFGLTQEQMAQRTGKDRASVANYMRLLRLPETVQDEIARGTLSFGHAKVLLSLATPQMIEHLAVRIAKESLSVRQTEAIVGEMLAPEAKPERPPKPVDPNVRQAEQELARALGLRVRIKDRRGRGKIVIEYASVEDFDRVLAALGK